MPQTDAENKMRWASYRALHLDEIAKKDSAWRKRNPLRHAEKCQKWVSNNPEKVKARHKTYRDKNKDKTRESARRYRARKTASQTHSSVPIQRWDSEVRNRLSISCYWCFGKIAGSKIELDHIVALTNGGAHEIGNLCVSCKPCNSRKQARSLSAWNSLIESPVLF